MDYQIAHDGTIFKIEGNGNITKIAKISDEGKIEGMNQTSRGKGALIFFLIVFFIATVVLTICYVELNDNYNWQRRRANDYEEKYDNAQSNIKSTNYEIDNLRSELSELTKLNNKWQSEFPIIISSIEIGNTDYDGDIQTDYGSSIYSYNTMYLKPKISYYGLKSASITLKTKWYNPDGSIRRGTSSPTGFSQSDSYYISTGYDSFTMSSWGNSTRGHWSSGTYRLEIWYDNVCLKAKTFTIY